MSAPDARGNRALALLVLGSFAGMALAAVSLTTPGARAGLPPGAIASVNGTPIENDRFERLVAALASDKRAPIDTDDRRRVLDRLIDEELLVQRAVELDLLRHDRRVRAELADAVIATVVAQADAAEPSAEDLESFYVRNHQRFASPERLRVRRITIVAQPTRTADEAASRAEAAAGELAEGAPFDDVRTRWGDRNVVELPDVPLSPAKLQEYLGPTATRTALELEHGRTSAPIRTAGGFEILDVVDRVHGRVPGLAEITDLVKTEYERHAHEQALRRYLDELRDRAEVVVSSRLP